MKQLLRDVWPIVGGALLLSLALWPWEAGAAQAGDVCDTGEPFAFTADEAGNLLICAEQGYVTEESTRIRQPSILACDWNTVLRLTRWYVDHVRPKTADGPWVSTVCGCGCLDGSARYRCLAHEAEAEEQRLQEQQQKRGGLLRVLEQCEQRIK